MFGAILFLVFQVPNEHVVRVDGVRTFQTSYYDVYQSMNLFCGPGGNTYVSELEQAKIFKTRVEAEIYASHIRNKLRMSGWDCNVWITKPSSFQYNTGFHQEQRYIWEDKL